MSSTSQGVFGSDRIQLTAKRQQIVFENTTGIWGALSKCKTSQRDYEWPREGRVGWGRGAKVWRTILQCKR